MSLSLWIEKDKTFIKIVCEDADSNHCWNTVKQNDVDTTAKKVFACEKMQYFIVNCEPTTVLLHTKKNNSLGSVLKRSQDLQKLFNAEIDVVVIDEAVFDEGNLTRRTDRTVAELSAFQCRSLVVRGTSSAVGRHRSEGIMNLLEHITIMDSFFCQIKVLQKRISYPLQKIPNVSMKLQSSYSNILKNAGNNTLFQIKKCGVGFINKMLMMLICGESFNIATLWLTVKKLTNKPTDKFLKGLKHIKKQEKDEFHGMSFDEQIKLLSTDGLDIRRIDGTLITVFLKQRSPTDSNEKTFIIHLEYPWEDQLSAKIPDHLATYEINSRKYEDLMNGQNGTAAGITKTTEESNKSGELCDEPLLKKNLLVKTDLADAEKAKLEFEKHILERKLEHGEFISSLYAGAAKRKEFGFLSNFFK